MVVNIHKLIAAVCPDVFCKKSLVPKVKSEAKLRGYCEAAEIAEVVAADMLDLREQRDPFDLAGLQYPTEMHSLVYQSSSPYVSPLYFWCVDRLRASRYAVDKLTDSLAAAPGGSQNADFSSKAIRSQEQTDKALRMGYEAIEMLLGLLAKAKQLGAQLQNYAALKTDDERKRGEAIWALKNLWLTKVDEKRGDMSLLRLCQQPGHQPLRMLFMAEHPMEEMQRRNLDGELHVVLKDKLNEFGEWVLESERDTGVAFDMTRVKLRDLIEKLSVCGQWIKPFLWGVRLRPGERIGSADVASIFNTAVVDIMLLGRKTYDVEEAVTKHAVPTWFKNVPCRNYFSLVLVEFTSRVSAPQKGQGISGRTEVNLASYALNEQEMEILMDELGKDNLRCALEALGGIAPSRIQQIEEDLKAVFVNHSESKEEGGWLACLWPWGRKNRKADRSKDIPPDSSFERIARSEAALCARKMCRALYLEMKGQLGMAVS